MGRKTYFWAAVTWCVIGGLFGAYFPLTDTSHKLYLGLNAILQRYPFWLHVPLLACLLLLFFQPLVDILRRYRHNWSAKVKFFTILDGIAFFTIGSAVAALLNRSLLYTLSQFPHSVAMIFRFWCAASITCFVTAFVRTFTKVTVARQKSTKSELLDTPITEDGD